jgi:hypothetical protein
LLDDWLVASAAAEAPPAMAATNAAPVAIARVTRILRMSPPDRLNRTVAVRLVSVLRLRPSASVAAPGVV